MGRHREAWPPPPKKKEKLQESKIVDHIRSRCVDSLFNMIDYLCGSLESLLVSRLSKLHWILAFDIICMVDAYAVCLAVWTISLVDHIAFRALYTTCLDVCTVRLAI